MYSTIVQCDLRNLTSAPIHGHAGRALSTALAALPGFLAFVAIESDVEAGRFITICLVEERAGVEEAERVIAQWQREHVSAVGCNLRRLGAGEVIAQRGL
jgi:hypothetical protein